MNLRSILGWSVLEDVAVLDVLINLEWRKVIKWDLKRENNLCPEEIAGDHLPRDGHGVLGSILDIHRSVEGPYLCKYRLLEGPKLFQIFWKCNSLTSSLISVWLLSVSVFRTNFSPEAVSRKFSLQQQISIKPKVVRLILNCGQNCIAYPGHL